MGGGNRWGVALLVCSIPPPRIVSRFMDTFESIDQLLRLAPGFALKFLVAVLCGGAIGMERETTGKPAGLRTSIIVCVGAMIFTVMSVEMAKGNAASDPTRIAAQIVSGIGFLGAGAILHEKGNIVKGMTTAAIIWLMASIGMMIGYGYLLSACVVSAAVVVMILALHRLELKIHRRLSRVYRFFIDPIPQTHERVLALLDMFEDHLGNYSIEKGGQPNAPDTLTFHFFGAKAERRQLLKALYDLDGVHLIEHHPLER